MKKFLVLLLVLSMVMTASAFAALPLGLELAPTPEDYAYTDLSEHKTVVMYLVGDGESTYPDFPEILGYVNEELAKFNTTLEITVISWSDAGTMYPLILTGGEKADLIFTATWRNLWTGAADESFYQMDMEFIETYMPYTFEYQPHESYLQTTYNGSIIAISQNKTPSSPQLVGIRTDLAEEYGLSTDINTWEELKEYMYGIAAHTEETGIFAYNAGKTDMLVSTNVVPRMFDQHTVARNGFFRFTYGDGSVPAPEDIRFYYTSDSWEFVVNESYQLAQDGIWSRSALSKTENGQQSFQNGTGAVLIWNYTIYQYMTYLETNVLGVEKMSATKGIALYSGVYGFDVEGYNNNCVSILAGSEDPYRAAMVLDILKFNTTLNTYLCLGVEGRHYIDLGDGIYEAGPEKNAYAPSGMSWSWATQNDNWKAKDDRPDQTEMYDFCVANAAVNPTMSFVFDPAPVSAYYAAIQAAIEENQYTLGLGLVDDPAAAQAAFVDTLNASGLEMFVEEYTAQYTEWYNAQ